MKNGDLLEYFEEIAKALKDLDTSQATCLIVEEEEEGECHQEECGGLTPLAHSWW